MVKNFLKTNWIKLPALIYIIGFLIHNFYLSIFNIYDFEIIQARYLYTGSIAFLFILSVYLFTLLRLDLGDIESNFSYKNLYFWIYRIILFSIVFYVLLFSRGQLDLAQKEINEQLSTEKVFSFVVSIAAIFLFMLTLFVGLNKENIKEPVYKMFNFISYIASPFIIIAPFFLKTIFENYPDVFYFFAVVFLGMMFMLFGVHDARIGVNSEFLGGKTSKTAQDNFGSVWGITSGLLAIMVILNLYATKIYPLISTSWGGGKLVQATVITKQESYTGNLISEGSSWTYIIGEDESAIKIRTNNINIIKLTK